jgi:HSP20 family protein
LKIAILGGADGEAEELDDAWGDEPQNAPPHELAEDAFGQNFHRMFDAFFSGKHPFFCPEGRAWNPPTDIFETEDALHVKIEVAGLRERDIDVKVNRDYLVIRGHRQDADQLNNARFHLMEIHYGSFERVVRLPHPVDVKKIEATLQNGFLKVRVPKDGSVAEYRIEIE